jgi:hypothetical protein
MYDLLTKEGETSTLTDETKSTVGVNPDQQPPPEDRKRTAGTIDAPWGERDGPEKGTSVHFSDAAAEGFIQSRQNILDELFDMKGTSSATEQKLVGQYLDHGESGDFESKAPLLETKTASDRTLRELVGAISD